MPATRPRRPLVQRACLSTAAVALVLAGYVLGCPFVIGIADAKYQPALPVLDLLYAPLHFYANHRELPGSNAYNEYGEWVLRRFREKGVYGKLTP